MIWELSSGFEGIYPQFNQSNQALLLSTQSFMTPHIGTLRIDRSVFGKHIEHA